MTLINRLALTICVLAVKTVLASYTPLEEVELSNIAKTYRKKDIISKALFFPRLKSPKKYLA